MNSCLARPLLIMAMMLVLFLAHNRPGFAQTTTDRMSCAAAQKQFSASGRVYVRTRDGQVLPISQGVAKDKAFKLNCSYDSFTNPIMVPTKDRPQCVVAYSCG